MSLFLTVLLLLKQLRPFPHFQLFIIFQFTLLRRLFFSHIPFQILLLLPVIPLFPLKNIIWLSFDSITTSLGSLFFLWPGGTVADFRFETDLYHHRIASFFSKSNLAQYTTLSHLLHHFNLFKNNRSSSHLDTQKQCIHHDRNTRTLASGLTIDVASLRKKDVLDNLASGRTTDVASLCKKDVLDNLASGLTTDVASLRKKDVLDNLASGLTTCVATLRRRMYLITWHQVLRLV